MIQFGFIGCGNMGSALVRAVAKTLGGDQIAVCDHSKEKEQRLVAECGVVALSAEEIAASARFVVLGVKPQAMQAAVEQVRAALQGNVGVSLVTMAAGLSMNCILGWAGMRSSIIRIMPNTPCELGEGAVLFCCDGVSEAQKKSFFEAFSAVGKIFPMDEATLDAAGALSGCGPAFVYLFADALSQGAANCGVEKGLAIQLAARTILGAAKMLERYGDPQRLTEQVCSPGGTTLAGVKALTEGEFSKVVQNAVEAAFERTLQLKQ